MIGFLLYYRINTVISVVLASFVFSLILLKSQRMKTFKWHLLNIQAITLVETLYWCFLSAPLLITYPYPHGYCTGVLAPLPPVTIQMAIAVFLIGEIIGSLCIAFVFRYHMLMPRSDTTWIQSAIRKLPVLAVTLGYGNEFLYGGLTYMVDPSYVIPLEVVTIWVYPWSGLAIRGYVFSGALLVTILVHAKKILKAQRSQSFHKDVFRSLVLQTSVLSYGTLTIPCSVVAGYMAVGLEKYTLWSVKPYSPSVWCSTLKSISASLLICYTVRPFRQLVFGFFRPRKIGSNVTVISIS